MCGQTVWVLRTVCESWQLNSPPFSAIFIATESFIEILFKIKQQQLA